MRLCTDERLCSYLGVHQSLLRSCNYLAVAVDPGVPVVVVLVVVCTVVVLVVVCTLVAGVVVLVATLRSTFRCRQTPHLPAHKKNSERSVYYLRSHILTHRHYHRDFRRNFCSH